MYKILTTGLIVIVYAVVIILSLIEKDWSEAVAWSTALWFILKFWLRK